MGHIGLKRPGSERGTRFPFSVLTNRPRASDATPFLLLPTSSPFNTATSRIPTEDYRRRRLLQIRFAKMQAQSACLKCSERKKKCDKAYPVCGQCERYAFKSLASFSAYIGLSVPILGCLDTHN